MFFVDPTNWRDKGANMCWQALEKEISVVKVVVASPTATKTVRSRRVTFSDQVGSLGKETENEDEAKYTKSIFYSFQGEQSDSSPA